MEYGMTPQGFVPKRLAEIQGSLNNRLSDIVDPTTNEFPFQNVSDDSILQQIVGVFSEALSEVWNAAYDAYTQFDPLKNTGAGQSGTVQLNAIQRKPGAPTILLMRMEGKPNTTIPIGSRIADASNQHVFTTDHNAVIGASKIVDVQCTCTTKGPFDPAPSTVVTIQTPVNGWNKAHNIATLAVGTAEETDEELRMRQQRSTSLTSYRLIDAIYAAVYNVPGVIFSRAYQNTDAFPADSRGIPFKEVAVVAEGGDPRDIAEAIFLRLPTGQVGFGDVTEVFYDSQGIANPISFSRPIGVDIYVHVEVTIVNRDMFPDNAAEQIKQNIVDFAQYGGGGQQDGFPPGSNIIRTRLYTPINQVPGHSVTLLMIGTSPALADEDIMVDWKQVGRFDKSRITVDIISE